MKTVFEKRRAHIRYTDPELLTQLTMQGFDHGLAGLDAASRKAPLTGEDPPVRVHAAEQQLLASIPNQTDNDCAMLDRFLVQPFQLFGLWLETGRFH